MLASFRGRKRDRFALPLKSPHPAPRAATRAARQLNMDAMIVSIPGEHIVDWDSFHDVFQQTLGFPSFYGRNMDAWIDCMTCVDDADDGMSAITVPIGAVLALQINDARGLRRRCPEQYDALLECSASVNYRRREKGLLPVVALILSGA